MIVIGELINSTRKAIAQAISNKDKLYIQDLARRQVEAGANYIDVNGASGGDEIENIKWMVELIQEFVDVPLCIDSPNPQAIKVGLELCNKIPIINSITAETERWEQVLPMVQEYKTKIIALCMDDTGMPESIEERLRVADKLVTGLTRVGIPEDDISLDPLVKPLGVNHTFGVEVLETTRALRQKYPNVHLVSGLSNISFGLPERKLLNRVFMVMSAAMGMDAYILDPLDQTIMSLLAASRTLAGQDEYCMDYITRVREGKIKA